VRADRIDEQDENRHQDELRRDERRALLDGEADHEQEDAERVDVRGGVCPRVEIRQPEDSDAAEEHEQRTGHEQQRSDDFQHG